MNGALTQPFSICTADVILLSGTGTGVLWPCSKPLGGLLPRGTLVYDTSLHNAPSHCLAQFLVQVTSHPHPGFGLSLRVEVLPSPQDSTPSMFKASITFSTLTAGACSSLKPTKLYCPSAPSINLPPLKYPENIHWDQGNLSSTSLASNTIVSLCFPLFIHLLYNML